MALTMPSHRIQTIHGVFGSPSWSSILPASSSSHSHELSFTSLPNASFSSIRGRGGINLSMLQARVAIPSNAAPSAPVVTRPRRSSIHGLPVSMRRAPPPPPVTRATITTIEDPFADKPVEQEFTVETLPPPRTRPTSLFSRTQMSAYTSGPSSYVYSSSTPVRAQRDDQRTAKLVASVLLSRASGKPMRRRCLASGERSYVKSGLSQLVTVEC